MTTDGAGFHLGSAATVEVDVRVTQVLHAEEDIDPHWRLLATPITASSAGLRADVPHATMHLGELLAFRRSLQALHAELRGTAELRTLEGHLDLSVAITRMGHLDVMVEIVSDPASDNHLHLQVPDLDQSHLTQLIDGLLDIEARHRA